MRRIDVQIRTYETIFECVYTTYPINDITWNAAAPLQGEGAIQCKSNSCCSFAVAAKMNTQVQYRPSNPHTIPLHSAPNSVTFQISTDNFHSSNESQSNEPIAKQPSDHHLLLQPVLQQQSSIRKALDYSRMSVLDLTLVTTSCGLRVAVLRLRLKWTFTKNAQVQHCTNKLSILPESYPPNSIALVLPNDTHNDRWIRGPVNATGTRSQ